MFLVIFLNLLVNSSFSLAAGLMVVLFFIWLFRIETGAWKLFLLSLPFFKIVYDFMRGLPPDSILYTNIDPFSLPPNHHMLHIGAGFGIWGPVFDASFTVQDLTGKELVASVGDHFAIWMQQKLGYKLLLLSLVVTLIISGILFSARLIVAYRFERKRRIERKHDLSLKIKKLWKRKIDIYISDTFFGSPFTGGVLRPYICIPSDTYNQLTDEELSAVIAHEIGHVRQFDLVVTMFIQALGDLFWFIPGYRIFSRKIDRIREIVADELAVRSGVEPMQLASALLKLKKAPESSERLRSPCSAFIRKKSLLKVRIERLICKSREVKPRFGWQNKWLRILFSTWIFFAVMSANFGGNHSNMNQHPPKSMEHFLRAIGF